MSRRGKGLGRLARGALDLLLPPACALCGRATAPGRPPLCSLCEHRLPVLRPPHCRRCGAPGPGRCPSCEGWSEEAPPCAAACAMRDGAAGLVHALKYGGWSELSLPMARAMWPGARRLLEGEDGPAWLVPVPLSPARLRERGFNQAERLAAALAAMGGWRIAPLLVRRRTGRPQARLGRAGRAANVRDLFAMRSNARGSDGVRETVGGPPSPTLLVDDVVTTGWTAAACARALRTAGSRCVGVVSFARTLQDLDLP